MNRARLALALGVLLPGLALAQSNDLMTREIDEALAEWRFRLGPVRMTPVIRVGAGVDTNPLSQPQPSLDQDTTFVFGPGIRGVVPFGNRGLLEVYQDVSYVYYRELENLRSLNSVSAARAAIGGRDFVLHGRGGVRRGQLRPTGELDVPLDVRVEDLGASLEIALGSAQQLNFKFDTRRHRFTDPESVDLGVSVPSLLDRRERQIAVEVERYLTASSSFVAETVYDVIDFRDPSVARDGTGVRARAGLIFSPQSDVRGQALFGYRRLVPDSDVQADFSGFVASADVVYPLGDRLRIRGLVARDTIPSIVPDNWFYVDNRVGGSVDLYLAERWFVRPGVVLGTSTYPRQTTFLGADGRLTTEVIQDDFRSLSLSINYELGNDLILGIGMDFQSRSSNFPQFDKDRNLFNVTLTTEL